MTMTLMKTSTLLLDDFVEVSDEPYRQVLEKSQSTEIQANQQSVPVSPGTSDQVKSDIVYEEVAEEDEAGDSENEVEQWLVQTVSGWDGAKMVLFFCRPY